EPDPCRSGDVTEPVSRPESADPIGARHQHRTPLAGTSLQVLDRNQAAPDRPTGVVGTHAAPEPHPLSGSQSSGPGPERNTPAHLQFERSGGRPGEAIGPGKRDRDVPARAATQVDPETAVRPGGDVVRADTLAGALPGGLGDFQRL